MEFLLIDPQTKESIIINLWYMFCLIIYLTYSIIMLESVRLFTFQIAGTQRLKKNGHNGGI